MRELAEKAVACEGWRWMAGMLARPVGGGFPVRLNCKPTPHMPDAGNVRYEPDLTDPATLGCLLALVRAALSYEHVWLARDCVVDPLDDDEYTVDERGGWTVWGAPLDNGFVQNCGSGATEAEALVEALEAAP
jgi:hypothetical protein